MDGQEGYAVDWPKRKPGRPSAANRLDRSTGHGYGANRWCVRSAGPRSEIGRPIIFCPFAWARLFSRRTFEEVDLMTTSLAGTLKTAANRLSNACLGMFPQLAAYPPDRGVHAFSKPQSTARAPTLSRSHRDGTAIGWQCGPTIARSIYRPSTSTRTAPSDNIRS